MEDISHHMLFALNHLHISLRNS